jgi:dTDP-4-amino-4,6-dideoxy-D-glucose acyltransferase
VTRTGLSQSSEKCDRMALLGEEIIAKMGFGAIGKNVSISDRASFYNCGNISIGSNVRIDDFCVLSAGAGGICIGNNVHIAVYSSLIGSAAIRLSDFSNLSSRVAIYSSSDDFSGEWMTNPTVPSQFTGVWSGEVSIGRHVVVGTGSVILPGVTLGDGVSVGALSLVKRDCEGFGIYAGSPVRRIGTRKYRILELEREFLSKDRN